MSHMPPTPPWSWGTWSDQLLADRVVGEETIEDSLDLAQSLSGLGAALGATSWATLSAMATLGSLNLSIARAVEPHIDAAAILHQAQQTNVSSLRVLPGQTWGVYAAHPPGMCVDAVPVDSAAANGSKSWVLSGAKPWCSLADQVSHALLTATVEGGRQRLFALDLCGDGVRVEMSQWKALGLRDIHTGTVHLEHASAYPVGPTGWYVDRPGFAWGGIVVAAIWFGAAAALAGQLWSAADRRAPDQVALMHIGSCEAALSTALTCLRSAAVTMDDPLTTSAQAAITASRARAVVAGVAEQVIVTVGHALGPGPLAFDHEHATRVADLTLYLRQHHAERDVARLGALALDAAQSSNS